MARLGDVCTISSSNVTMLDDKVWLLNLDMVEQQTGNIISYNYVGNDELNGSIIQFDTTNVLYSKLRPNLNKVVIPDRGGFATSEMLPLKPNSNVLSREYLAAYLRSDAFVSWAVSKTAGAKMPRLGTKVLLDKEIPIPPLEEQHKIAEQLDKVSDLIAKRRAQLDKLDLLVKARFSELVSNSHAKKCPEPLGNYLDNITYGFTNPMPDTEEGPWKVTAKDICNGKINFSTARKTSFKAFDELTQKSKPIKGDILLTKDGTLGRVALVEHEDICVNQSVAVLRCNVRVLPAFLFYLLQMPEYQSEMISNAGGGTIKHIYITKVDKMLVGVPELSIQSAFLFFANRAEKNRAIISNSLGKLETLKKALMQQYFE